MNFYSCLARVGDVDFSPNHFRQLVRLLGLLCYYSVKHSIMFRLSIESLSSLTLLIHHSSIALRATVVGKSYHPTELVVRASFAVFMPFFY